MTYKVGIIHNRSSIKLKIGQKSFTLGFYSNQICLPTYYSTWIGPDNDNPYATFELGERYARLSTATGLLFDDGQQGSITDRQKEYLRGFAPKSFIPVVSYLCNQLNRYSGMVGFWWQEYPPEDYEEKRTITGFWVSYDQLEKNSNPDYFPGEAFTRAINVSSGQLDLLEWLNPGLRTLLEQEGFISFEFIDTLHGSNRILPLLTEIVQRANIIWNPRRSQRLQEQRLRL